MYKKDYYFETMDLGSIDVILQENEHNFDVQFIRQENDVYLTLMEWSLPKTLSIKTIDMLVMSFVDSETFFELVQGIINEKCGE